MFIFDAHIHIFPDKIAALTTEKLGDNAGIKPSYDGSREALLASMRQAGIDAALNCPIATRPEQVESINRWARAQNRRPVFSLGTIHHEHPEAALILQKLKQDGIPGIKLHPEYQQFKLADEKMQVIWQTCSNLDLPILMHCGADIGFPPPYHSNPAEIRELLETYPALRLVAAHFGSWNMWEEVEQELIGTSVFLDVSYTDGYLYGADLVRMARRHGIDKIIFGTDAPWREQKHELDAFKALDFSSTEQELILAQNALELFRLREKITDRTDD